MTYQGSIQAGAIVLDEPPELPEGVRVRCELTIETQDTQAQDPKIAAEGGTLVQKSKEFLAAPKLKILATSGPSASAGEITLAPANVIAVIIMKALRFFCMGAIITSAGC